MVGREDVASEREKNNDEHQHFCVVLNGLEDDQFTLNEGQPIMTDKVTVGRMKRSEIGIREEGGTLVQLSQQKQDVFVLFIHCEPIKGGRNWLSRKKE